MPRPLKRRRICSLPQNRIFAPKGTTGEATKIITMTLDEYESIRLIDLEGMSQEACAESMGVARTTAQAIYNSARVKLAECLINGHELRIEGGEYILCQGEKLGCKCNHCHKKRAILEIENGDV